MCRGYRVIGVSAGCRATPAAGRRVAVTSRRTGKVGAVKRIP